MMLTLSPPDYPLYPVHCTGSACTFERHTSKKVCNTRLDSAFNKLSIVALKRDRPALPSRSPATQPLISSCTGAVMSDTSRGGTPDPTIAIIPSSQIPDLPSRRSLAFRYPRAVSSPSAMWPELVRTDARLGLATWPGRYYPFNLSSASMIGMFKRLSNRIETVILSKSMDVKSDYFPPSSNRDCRIDRAAMPGNIIDQDNLQEHKGRVKNETGTISSFG